MTQFSEITDSGQHILYDAALLTNIGSEWFEPDYWSGKGSLTGIAQGRGTVHFFRHGGGEYVLRHYRRGGKAAAFLFDRYLWCGLRRTRPWRELALLARLSRRGLPVPVPVAARVCRQGMMYTADLITAKISNSLALSERLTQSALALETWAMIGSTLKRFHLEGVWHADLNAHNILLGSDQVHVIDFDKGRLRMRGSWRRHNLARLQRSLIKLSDRSTVFYFQPSDWAALLAAYQAL